MLGEHKITKRGEGHCEHMKRGDPNKGLLILVGKEVRNSDRVVVSVPQVLVALKNY